MVRQRHPTVKTASEQTVSKTLLGLLIAVTVEGRICSRMKLRANHQWTKIHPANQGTQMWSLPLSTLSWCHWNCWGADRLDFQMSNGLCCMPQLCLWSVIMHYCYTHFRVEPQIIWSLFVWGLGIKFLPKSQVLKVGIKCPVLFIILFTYFLIC